MRQAMYTLRLLTTFTSSMLSKNTKVALPYRLFSTAHEKTITVEQHHFDLLKKESEVLSQQIQAVSSSINSLENKFISIISNLDNKFTSTISNLDNKFTTALQAQSNYLDMKMTNGLESLRKEMKEENKALESKIETLRKDMKEENSLLRQEMKEENSLLRQEMKEDNKALESKIDAKSRHIIGTAIGLASLFFTYDQYKEQNKPKVKASLGNEATAKPAEKSAFKFPSIFGSSYPPAKDSNMLPRQ